MFYMVTADGLFICRNHEFFTSCVPTDDFHAELKEHRPFLRIRYPRISQPLFEMVMGFFTHVAARWGTEVAVLLAVHETGQVTFVVPTQTVGPGHVDYDVPLLRAGWRYFGDIHSHVDMSAFASGVDTADEKHRPGLHIVVGRLYSKRPEFHVEAVVDGVRFPIGELGHVVDAYDQPAPFPDEWMDKLTKKRYQPIYLGNWDRDDFRSGTE
jgi:PRTRC genetic system protein A